MALDMSTSQRYGVKAQTRCHADKPDGVRDGPGEDLITTCCKPKTMGGAGEQSSPFPAGWSVSPNKAQTTMTKTFLSSTTTGPENVMSGNSSTWSSLEYHLRVPLSCSVPSRHERSGFRG